METVRGNGDPPPELRLHWWASNYNALPSTGGVYEQDYFLLEKMTICANVHSAYSRLINMQGAQIHKLTESERKILRVLMNLGLL